MEAPDTIPSVLTEEQTAQLKARGISEEKANEILAELGLKKELSDYFKDLAGKLERGEVEVTMDDMALAVNAISEKYGCEYGVPLPSTTEMTRPMVLAKGTPFSRTGLDFRTELEQEIEGRFSVRNSWSMLGDKEVCIIETKEGPMALPRYFAGTRLRKILDGAMIRHGTTQTVEAEMKAREALKARLNENQWRSYVLCDMFPEKSSRSDIHYFFRKGLPTIAVTYHSGYGGDYSGGKVLACLCQHPVGYFQGTHCGLMVPTDEVISSFMMMRGDEPKFWASCGQWSASDTRSGV